MLQDRTHLELVIQHVALTVDDEGAEDAVVRLDPCQRALDIGLHVPFRHLQRFAVKECHASSAKRCYQQESVPAVRARSPRGWRFPGALQPTKAARASALES